MSPVETIFPLTRRSPLTSSVSVGVFGIVLFSRDSFSKNSSESGLGPSNIIVLRKIPKNAEPKIEVVIIKIDLADNYHFIILKLLDKPDLHNYN